MFSPVSATKYIMSNRLWCAQMSTFDMISLWDWLINDKKQIVFDFKMNCIVSREITTCFLLYLSEKRKSCYSNTFIKIKQHMQFCEVTDKAAVYDRLITKAQQTIPFRNHL